MVREVVILCDICRKQVANTKCFICNRDICDEHNFGGDHASILINATVYNENVFDIGTEDKFIDCCANCADKLNNIMSEKKGMMEDKLKEDLKNIKTWLLDEIKKK